MILLGLYDTLRTAILLSFRWGYYLRLELLGTRAKGEKIGASFAQCHSVICTGLFIRFSDSERVLLPKTDRTNLPITFWNREVVAAVALEQRFRHLRPND